MEVDCITWSGGRTLEDPLLREKVMMHLVLIVSLGIWWQESTHGKALMPAEHHLLLVRNHELLMETASSKIGLFLERIIWKVKRVVCW